MKNLLFLFLCAISLTGFAQEDERISVMDFVQVLNENHAEALYYYQQNWQILRERAIEKEYIASFQFLENKATAEAPFNFILITTFKDASQYEKREEHFEELIKEKGSLSLLNDKKPGDFRKIAFTTDKVGYLKQKP